VVGGAHHKMSGVFAKGQFSFLRMKRNFSLRARVYLNVVDRFTISSKTEVFFCKSAQLRRQLRGEQRKGHGGSNNSGAENRHELFISPVTTTRRAPVSHPISISS
jgi:hypothetical protein